MQTWRVQPRLANRSDCQRGPARAGLGCAAAVLCALLLGCSRSESPNSAGTAAAAPQVAQPARPSDPRSDTDADLVSAVGPAGSEQQPIHVKFRLSARPALGVPLQILVSVAPTQDAQVDHIQGSFLPDNGLKLQSPRTFDQDDLHEPMQRMLTVVPQQPGVLNLNATFTLELGDHSISCSYAIPVIVADNS